MFDTVSKFLVQHILLVYIDTEWVREMPVTLRLFWIFAVFKSCAWNVFL